MKLIIWLWNPWEQYKNTRHNLGFLFLDYLKEQENFSEFKWESKFKWEISTWILKKEHTLLLKPKTFMNLSWESLRKVVDFYKIDLNDIIVIFDDISINFWKIRFRDTGSAWGHNGIKDIIQHFSQDFKRVKVWVGLNDKYEVSDWVLSKFTEEELIELHNNIFKQIYDTIIKEL